MFLVRTYLGVWSQRKTPDILQVTVIRTLRSDLNIKRELIWCKGRKQWFLLSCKEQPLGSYLFRNTVSCHFHLTNILFVDLLPNKLSESCVIYFSNGGRKNPCLYKTPTREQTAFQCLSTIVTMSCPDANSIVKQEDTRKRIKLRSYTNLSFIYTDSMNLQIFSARSSNSNNTVLSPGLTFPPSGLPLGEKSSHQQFADHHRLESQDLLSCGDATVKIGTVCYEVYLWGQVGWTRSKPRLVNIRPGLNSAHLRWCEVRATVRKLIAVIFGDLSAVKYG